MKRIVTTYLKPFYQRMALGMFFKFSGSIMDLFLPYILAVIIDTVIPQHDKTQIYYWGVVMLICSTIGLVFNIIANRMAARVASDAVEVIRRDLFTRVMYLSNHQMDMLTKPSVISRLTTDTYNIHQIITRIQRLGIRAPIMLIGGMIITITLDPVLAAVLLGIMPIMVIIITLITKRSIPLFAVLQQTIDRFVRLVREDINGIRVIKALSKTNYEKERFDAINDEVVSREKRARMTVAVIQPAMNVCLNLGLVCVILVGAYGVNQGITEVGKILAFMSYFAIILQSVLSVSKIFETWTKATASAERIVGVLDLEEELTIQAIAEKRSDYFVEFEKVTFSYDKEEPNLSDISFALKKGETLGIIGETGSGKSTLLNLLMRFYDPDSGAIYIDGNNVKSISPRQLHQRFGAVLQNDIIFEATIEENVRLERNLTKEEISDAIFYAGAQEFAAEKSAQSDEALAIKGANLSGGQKQRLLIARALAAKPEILILDDASSALDYQTDAAFRQVLREQFGEATILIVAQRVSSIRHADHILVLENGAVIGYGQHRQLMETCEVYREISFSQMGVS